MNLAQVKAKNDEELKKFTDFLNLVPKTLLIYSASNALIMVMDPESVTHDSSNAAFNWRFSYGKTSAPLVLWDKGHEFVGFKGESRGENAAAHEAVKGRYGIEVTTLYQKSFITGTKGKAPKLTLYNSIGDLGIPAYTYNSKVRGAHVRAKTYAMAGFMTAQEVLTPFMNNGAKQSPNTKGLQLVIDQRFGGL